MRSKYAHGMILVLGLGFSLWMCTTFKLHYDHEQILSKVHKLLTTGEWTHFGNRGTGVGYIPGTFLTAVAAGPMAIWYSPYSAMFVIQLSQLFALFCFYFPARRIFGVTSSFIFLILFWLSPWRIEQSELYNPSYLFFFSGLHFLTAFQLSKRKSFWMSVLHVLALGLCAQVHFSVLILGITSLFLWWFRMIKINWYGVLVGVLLTLLTLTPYFLSLAQQSAEGIHVDTESGFFPGKNLLLVYPVLKAALYWLRYSSFYFARHIFTEVHFLWLEPDGLRAFISGFFHFMKWPIGIATLLVSILFQWKFLKQVWSQLPLKRILDRTQIGEKDWIFHYAFYLFLGMIGAAALSPVEFNHWHLILCLPVSVLLVSVGAGRFLELHPRLAWTIPCVIIYFCIYNSLATMGSKMHDIHNDYHEEVLKAYPRGM